MLLFPCKGAEIARTAAQQTNLINYANAGGRVFATHFSYAWLYNDAPSTGRWTGTSTRRTPTPRANIRRTRQGTSTPRSRRGSSSPSGCRTLAHRRRSGRSPERPPVGHEPTRCRRPVAGVDADPGRADRRRAHALHVQHAVGAAAANQCGRVLFDDFHVENHGYINAQSAYNETFPAECACFADAGYCETNVECCSNRCDTNSASATYQTCLGAAGGCTEINAACTTTAQCCGGTCTGGVCVAPMTPQEKLLEFMIFDLGSCVAPDVPTCTPTTCAAQGFSCGPAGDGCGNVLQCGTCPTGETCGGGGTPASAGRAAPRRRAPARGSSAVRPVTAAATLSPAGRALRVRRAAAAGCPASAAPGRARPRRARPRGSRAAPLGTVAAARSTAGRALPARRAAAAGRPASAGRNARPRRARALATTAALRPTAAVASSIAGQCAAPNTCGGGGQANVCGGNIPK